jgi:4-nitrophenyl phosphatase
MTVSNLSGIKSLIVDMDGVLWRGSQSIGDLPAIFDKIAACGLKVVLATNNATLSVEQYLSKLGSMGVILKDWQVITSSTATALYIKHFHPEGGKVYIIGEDGLVQTLAKNGFDYAEQDVLAVVAGMDRQLTYEKLKRATLLIRSGIQFIGTNPDRTFPTPEGLVPGAGAILAAIEVATDQKPLVIGKPAPAMYQVALDRLVSLPHETLVVGDRLETDIVGAQILGCKTALVLSGVTSPEAAYAWSPPPDLIAPDLDSILKMITG